MHELDDVVAAGIKPQGHRGGLWDTDLFLEERGRALVFVPIHSLEVELPGRVRAEILPSVELVSARHEGTDGTVAEVYASLGRYVAEHEVSAEGPIRETYLSSQTQEIAAVTEIGWPVLREAS